MNCMSKELSQKDLSRKASQMYRMLEKIASNKEVWTLAEVRKLLSSISGTRKEF